MILSICLAYIAKYVYFCNKVSKSTYPVKCLYQNNIIHTTMESNKKFLSIRLIIMMLILSATIVGCSNSDDEVV